MVRKSDMRRDCRAHSANSARSTSPEPSRSAASKAAVRSDRMSGMSSREKRRSGTGCSAASAVSGSKGEKRSSTRDLVLSSVLVMRLCSSARSSEPDLSASKASKQMSMRSSRVPVQRRTRASTASPGSTTPLSSRSSAPNMVDSRSVNASALGELGKRAAAKEWKAGSVAPSAPPSVARYRWYRSRQDSGRKPVAATKAVTASRVTTRSASASKAASNFHTSSPVPTSLTADVVADSGDGLCCVGWTTVARLTTGVGDRTAGGGVDEDEEGGEEGSDGVEDEDVPVVDSSCLYRVHHGTGLPLASRTAALTDHPTTESRSWSVGDGAVVAAEADDEPSSVTPFLLALLRCCARVMPAGEVGGTADDHRWYDLPDASYADATTCASSCPTFRTANADEGTSSRKADDGRTVSRPYMKRGEVGGALVVPGTKSIG
mmetsp:Transcript_978/g.2982  ORF Transcript_978/g.2982 Transcript_978/m.2982 type:complete len:434 (+) Transcript_978:180-1481(+)